MKINENDFIFLKSYNDEKHYSFEVSKLELLIEPNNAGDTHVGRFGFALPHSKKGIASIGKSNPFNNQKLASLEAVQGTYTINSRIKLITKGPPLNNAGTEGFLVGNFTFLVQYEKRPPVLMKTMDVETDSYIQSVQVYGGEIFSDGSALIYVSLFETCGFFIYVKQDKAEINYPACGSVGC